MIKFNIRKNYWAKRFTIIITSGLIFLLVLGSGIFGAYYYVVPSLPAADTIREIPLQIPLRIYSRDGRLIEEVGERRRILITYDDLPQYVIDAFVSAEDGRFFKHPGIDYQGILRALFLLIKSGEISGGGSTITQQLARDYFLTREQLFTRKLREVFLAWKIEQAFTKEEIMALFLNKMFFGQRAYGVAAAALVYFGKPLDQLNIAEAATLAGVLPAPSDYNPVRSQDNAKMRRRYVLTRMHKLGYISNIELSESLSYPLESKLHGTKNELSAPYAAEMVRKEMLSRYGEKTYSAGFKVMTTLDSTLQEAANYAVKNGLFNFSRRKGYRGPIGNIISPMETNLEKNNWVEKIKNEIQNYQSPAGLSLAVVTKINNNNSIDVLNQDGSNINIPWNGISWAKQYIDPEQSGPMPKSAVDIVNLGDMIYIMPRQGGGWALGQIPIVQAAQVSIDPYDGAITSLVGGLDFTLSKFNRATQSARQPGSAFKPFIYSAALEAGNNLATIILDAPVVINSSTLERMWKPVNYSGRFYGEQRLREALVRSMNLASVRLLLDNTGIGKTVKHLAPFGFNEAALPRNGSLALGAGNASPLDIAQGYGTFANGGFAIKPRIIDSIIGPNEKTLYKANPNIACEKCFPKQNEQIAYNESHDPFDFEIPLEQMVELGNSYQPDANEAPILFKNQNLAERIISPQNAYLIQDAMRDVISRGTGIRARSLGRKDLSGKTGTSNDRRDAWFAGYNSKLVSVVWVGYDDDSPLGRREEGSRTALPIWIDFMKIALNNIPNNTMPMPEGIISVKISKKTGCPADASTPTQDVIFEHFRKNNIPACKSSNANQNIFNSSNNSDLF